MPEDFFFFPVECCCTSTCYFFANTLFLTVRSNDLCLKQAVNIQHVKWQNTAAYGRLYASVHIKSTRSV